MSDLRGLKKRVELIDLRLKTAHSARERESAALMEVWEQIRDRFLDQNAEIAGLRERIAELEDTRDDLLQMVHGLLSAVEGGLERMSDETVPQIKVLASGLLNEGSARHFAPPEARDAPLPDLDEQMELVNFRPDDASEEANFHSDLLNAIERSLGDAEESTAYEGSHRGAVAEGRRHRPVGGPASPGIRDLIARIEGAVGTELIETAGQSRDDEELDDELTRDLREIEALRGELHGLRERIANGSR